MGPVSAPSFQYYKIYFISIAKKDGLLSIQIQMANKQAECGRHDDGRNQANEQQGTHAFSPF